MRVLITGASGMIGSHLVKTLLDDGFDVVGIDRRKGIDNRAINIVTDLNDCKELRRIVEEYSIDRIIHLAALAHTAGEKELSWEKYYHINVECAKNIFNVADDRPVLFISTVDVYGFAQGIVNANTKPHPVTDYGKSKALAEIECKKLKNFTIFRFVPVYSPEIKRDIQKRYYLKYPNWAYIIGKGIEHEVVNINLAIDAMVNWSKNSVRNEIHIVKNPEPMNTADCIRQERNLGRAKHVLHFPKWLVFAGYHILCITGKNKYMYLLNKAVHPLRTE